MKRVAWILGFALLSFASTAVAAFNVKDFGAVGDGVSDDGPEIQAAIAAASAAGGEVYVPGLRVSEWVQR